MNNNEHSEKISLGAGIIASLLIPAIITLLLITTLEADNLTITNLSRLGQEGEKTERLFNSAIIIGGILTIAIADAFSDALGIHVSEESESKHTVRELWESTVSTFLFKFVFALTFIAPTLLVPLTTAIIVSVIWGLSLMAILSFYLAKDQRGKPWKVITEHLTIALLVIVLTHYAGDWIGSTFS